MNLTTQLGLVPLTTSVNMNQVKPVTLPTTTTTTTPKKSAWDTLTNIFDIAQKGADVYTTVKSTSSPTPNVNPGVIPTGPPPVEPGMSTTTKVLIGTGVAAVLGTAIYLIARSNKKKKKGD